ncbi:response regulator [Acidobacteriota bacterium]
MEIKRGNVLVADDEHHTRLALSLILKKAGFDVTSVGDGIKALNKIREATDDAAPFDLLVIDIQMPRLTGLEVIKELENLKVIFPILIISGYKHKEIVADIARSGCIAYAEKPFRPDELLHHIDVLLSEHARYLEDKVTGAPPVAGRDGMYANGDRK